MTANQSGDTRPLDGAFITTESLGGADPSTRKATFKIAFTGEGCIERAHAVEDYLKALVAADRAAPSPAAGSGAADTETERRRKMAVMKTLMHPPASPADGHDAGVVGDLVEALHEGRRAIGDHWTPNDCYATGPVTGDTFRDLVECPACSFIARYDAALAKYATHQSGKAEASAGPAVESQGLPGLSLATHQGGEDEWTGEISDAYERWMIEAFGLAEFEKLSTDGHADLSDALLRDAEDRDKAGLPGVGSRIRAAANFIRVAVDLRAKVLPAAPEGGE